MRVAVLFSGGKDSTFAAFLAKKAGHELVCLVSFFPHNPESYMFHHVNIGLTGKLARLMKVPHVAVRTAAEKEKEAADIEKTLRRVKKEYNISGVVSGALASNYQKKRIDAVCARLGLSSIAPLWQADQAERLREQRQAGFRTVVVAVAAAGLGEEWLGRLLDEKAVSELEKLHTKYGIHVGGEGGEYETLVTDCPLYSRPLKIKKTRRVWLGDRGVLEVEAEQAEVSARSPQHKEEA